LAGFDPPFPFDQIPPWLDRDAAMSVASVSRARDLIASAVSQCPLTLWVEDRSAIPIVERRVPEYPWMVRPDPNRTRQWLLAWTVDDLYFHGCAHWEITDRYATTFPSAFRRLPPGDLTESGGVWTVTDPITGARREIAERDIVEFLSPVQGLLSSGWRTISIALQLDAAADRFSTAEIPNGWLQQTADSEDLTAEEMADEALKFSTARLTNTTATVSKGLEYHPNVVNADSLQLVESRGYQALECARQGNVPPYLVGAPAGTGMTYQNGQQARQDLIDFGASAFIGCIEQTLSGPNVTPRGQAVRLDLNVYLRNPFTTPPDDAAPSPNDLQVADPSTAPPVPVEVPA
jgi:phage portal protein BeeE